MTDVARPIEPAGAPPLYGRLSRRIQAAMIDNILFFVALVTIIAIASSSSEGLSRLIGAVAIAAFVLYEPLMVAFVGSTLGHLRCNLRIVDERTGGNISFLRAVARFVIKVVLGWYSFLTMLTTKRYQAVHDLATRSTAQIRDVSKAERRHFHTERAERTGGSMPSALRRVAVIVLYLAVAFWFVVMAYYVLATAFGLMSDACVRDSKLCTAAERTAEGIAGLIMIVLLFAIVAAGWRGRLWGARRSR